MFGNLSRQDWILFLGFSAVVLLAPILFQPIGAAYPAILEKFCIFGLFAIGFNILFGLTGYLSFGHAAFLGVGSYAAVWSFKLFTMNVSGDRPVDHFRRHLCLRHRLRESPGSGIYFSILTLAFAQMSYNMATRS